jgi:WD40 repeat protein
MTGNAGVSGRRRPILSGCKLRRLLSLLALLPVLLLAAEPAHAAFPGANGKIVFHTLGTGYQVEAIEPNGSGRSVLFPGRDPGWSADGQRLGFTRGNDIFTARADGSDAVQVTQRYCDPSGLSSCAESRGATWSPDGSRLALWTWHCGGHTCIPIVSTINAGGSGENEIAVEAFDPAWSPDGSRIAFHNGSGISTVPPGGGEPTGVSGTRSTRIPAGPRMADGSRSPDASVGSGPRSSS